LGLSDNLLSQDEGDINEYREQLNIIYRNARRLQRLTEDILDVSKIEGQMLNLNKSQINLKEVIINTLTDFKAHFKNEVKYNKIKLDYVSNENEDIFVYVDPDRIAQVISNLLSNAVKFTEQGSITVTMERQVSSDDATTSNIKHGGFVRVSVKDTGIGVHPAVKDKLFDKFETRSEKGIGLGLYISRNIVEDHGGKIWVENNFDEKGTTFFFSLPVVN